MENAPAANAGLAAVLCVGPTLVLLGFGFTFFFIAALWAYYHLVKQHYGFMVLYKKKNNDLAALDNALDRLRCYLPSIIRSWRSSRMTGPRWRECRRFSGAA